MRPKPMIVLVAALALTAAIGAGSASGGTQGSALTQPPIERCPPTTHPRMGLPCRIVGNGNFTSQNHQLQLRIARSFVSMLIVCHKSTAETISCRLTNLRVGTPRATGWRIVRLTVPTHWTRVTFRCSSTNTAFACHLTSSS
jgi:hypothetical protein